MTLQLPFPQLVDSTMLSCFDSCPVKFLYEYLYKRSPLGINPDLHAGGAFARAMEVARRTFYQLHQTQEASLAAGVRAMVEFWGDFTPPIKSSKSLENMIGGLEDYFREYPLATDLYKPLILSDTSPAIEFTFSIPTDVAHPQSRDPILYGGRFDMLASYNDGEFLCIIDEKTTRGFGPTWATQWGMRGQFLGYVFGAQQYGHDVSRAIIRGIAILKTKYHHLQALEEYSQWQIARWWETTNYKIAQMVEIWKDNSWLHHLSYGDACTSYGGCAYLPICTSNAPESQLSLMQHRDWNPLKKDPTWPEGGPHYETIGTLDDLIQGLAGKPSSEMYTHPE